MSTLLAQVAEPQNQSTKRRKPRPQDPERNPFCKCGKRKKRMSLRCAECKIKDGKSVVDLIVVIIDGRTCRRLSLTQEQYAIVDEEDFDRVDVFEFFAVWEPNAHTFYAKSTQAAKVLFEKRGQYTLAAMILNLPFGTLVDHANGNTLDCRKDNLRPATYQQNARNRRIRSDNKSGYKGVNRVSKNCWRAYIFVDKKILYLGCFPTAILAAKARDVASLKYFGEFARLNFPELIDEYHAILATSEPRTR
jgi:hypothetical protein